MKVAVVAHYDPNDIWDENFLLLVQVLTEVMTQVIIVTTSDNIENLPIHRLLHQLKLLHKQLHPLILKH